MRFPASFLDDIKDRLRISEIVGARVQFDRKKSNAAKGDYWACCPFHQENTPSFHCDDRKGSYYCFGCQASGDHFHFLMELDGSSFAEAVERCAEQVGLQIPVMDKQEQKWEAVRSTLFDVMEIATNYFCDQLQTSQGARARAYLRDRGLAVETQRFFRLGFAPDNRNSLKEHLAAKGVEKERIEACGLVAHGEGIAVSYDIFRNRVMFPIPDSRGRIIAFGGRAMDDGAMAKYLNSPETPLFHKSGVLYNYANARKNVNAGRQVIAVEGYMDVIALHAAGFSNVTAPLGTALTKRQIELLWKINEEPVLCFDGDGAGIKAAGRAVDLILPALRPGRSARFAMLPEGLDPDDLIRQSGEEAFASVLKASMPLADMLWSRELHSGNMLNTPERKAEFEHRIKTAITQIRDESVRRHYRQDIDNRLAAYFGEGGRRWNSDRNQDRNRRTRKKSGQTHGFPEFAGNKSAASRMPLRLEASTSLINSGLMKARANVPPMRETALVMGMALHPALSAIFFDEFAALKLEHKGLARLRGKIVDALAEYDGTDDCMNCDELRAILLREGYKETLELCERQLRNNRVWQALPQAAFEDAVEGWKQAYALYLRNRALHDELKAAEQILARENNKENFERLLKVREEIGQDEGIKALIEGFGVSSGRPVKGL